MNQRFASATREVAFTLSLSYAQIHMLCEIRRRTEENPAHCLRVLDQDFEPEPQFGWAYHKATINCLWEKGLICKHKWTPIPTTAGLLTLQLLGQSGHLQMHRVPSPTVEEA